MICLSLFCLNFVPQRIRRPSRYIPTCIKQSNLLEVIICQVEVKEIDVLNHPFLVGCLWDNDNAVLNQEFQGYLCRCLAVFLADIRQRLVPEDAVLPSASGLHASNAVLYGFRYSSIFRC